MFAKITHVLRSGIPDDGQTAFFRTFPLNKSVHRCNRSVDFNLEIFSIQSHLSLLCKNMSTESFELFSLPNKR